MEVSDEGGEEEAPEEDAAEEENTDETAKTADAADGRRSTRRGYGRNSGRREIIFTSATENLRKTAGSFYIPKVLCQTPEI